MQGLLIENASGLPGIDINMMIEYLVLHLVAALRIGAFLIASPFFGARYVLLPIRILFTMVLAVILVPNIDIPDSQLIGTDRCHDYCQRNFYRSCGGFDNDNLVFRRRTCGRKNCLDRRAWFAAQMDPPPARRRR